MIMTTPPTSCLIVSLDNIGDLVFSASLLSQLEQAWPETQFGIWCKDYARDIATLLPGAPRIHAADPIWDRAPGRKPGHWRQFLRSMQEIRQARYPVAVVVSRQWRAACATALTMAGYQRRVGYAGRKSNLWLTHAVSRPSGQEAVTVEQTRLLEPLLTARSPAPYRLELEPLTARRQRLWRLRREQRRPLNYVALHAFAGDPRRCLPISRWLELGRRLSAEGTVPMWIGSKTELALIRGAASMDDKTFEYADWYSQGELIEAAALIAGAQSFIGHDSGPLHIASALGIPTLGLYLPGEPQRTFPQGVGRSQTIVRTTPDTLSVEEIWQAWHRLEADTHA